MLDVVITRLKCLLRLELVGDSYHKMCKQEKIRILEDGSNPVCFNTLLYDHTPMNIMIKTGMIPRLDTFH